jgi:predicted DNA-binding antitoxin AbrB/MazE fold protein
MRVISARVKEGAIVPDEGISLPEGSRVTVIADADEQRFETSPAEEDELLDSIREAERDEVVPAAEILRRLSR